MGVHPLRVLAHLGVLVVLVVATLVALLDAAESRLGSWVEPRIHDGDDGGLIVTIEAAVVAVPALAAAYVVALLVADRHRGSARNPGRVHAAALTVLVVLVVAAVGALTAWWDEFDLGLRHLALVLPPVLVAYGAGAWLGSAGGARAAAR